MIRAGDFDVARKSLVMQTLDQEANMLALFGDGAATTNPLELKPPAQTISPSPTPSPGSLEEQKAGAERASSIFTEAQALRELPGVPLYFASSHALVKPYVRGFETNLLDAPSLKRVSIDTAWVHPTPKQTITIARTRLP